MKRQPVLWTLRNGAKQLTCSVQLLPHGLELHLALNGQTPYCSRTFQAQDELLAWAIASSTLPPAGSPQEGIGGNRCGNRGSGATHKI